MNKYHTRKFDHAHQNLYTEGSHQASTTIVADLSIEQCYSG